METGFKKRRFHFGLAPRLIIGVIFIAVLISFLSVYIGQKTYWKDITDHYDALAKEMAKSVQDVLSEEDLTSWAETAKKLHYAMDELPPAEEEAPAEEPPASVLMDAEAAISDSIDFVNSLGVDDAIKQEAINMLQSEKYKETVRLVYNLRENINASDIYICYFDTDELESYSQESYDNGTWTPLIYIMDTYADSSWWIPVGAGSPVDPDIGANVKEAYLNGEQPHFEEPIVTYFTDTYILSGLTTAVYNGKTAAIIGVEIPLPTLESDMKNYVLNIVWVDLIALAAVLVVVIILIVFLVTKPIKTVAEEAERFVSDNAAISEKLGKIRTHDEIQTVSDSLLSLEYGVRDYIEHIKTMTAEKERIGAELSVATKIQAEMLPLEFPDSDIFDLYASMTPAKSVGGDFYDFFMIDDDHLALVMADVSGKGVPAALYMSITKTIMKNCAVSAETPSKALEAANNIICDVNKSGYFVTAWLSILDLITGELIYSNAGHEYPAIKRNGKYELIEADNCPPLGTMEDMEYFDEKLILTKGDSIFLYTDGVPEAKNADSQRYGLDRMLDMLNSNADLSSEELLKVLKKDIDSFAGDIDPFDDVTMMNVHLLQV